MTLDLEGGENLADSGWIAVAAAAVGGGIAGAITLLQALSLRRSETENRKRQDLSERRAELLQVYTRYQLAVDGFENAIRDLGRARSIATSEGASATWTTESADDLLNAFNAAQREYDQICEILKLVAPEKTTDAALAQRRLFNGFASEAHAGRYVHDASTTESIGAVGKPVLAAMRWDLRTPEKTYDISMSTGPGDATS